MFVHGQRSLIVGGHDSQCQFFDTTNELTAKSQFVVEHKITTLAIRNVCHVMSCHALPSSIHVIPPSLLLMSYLNS
jgi:hypothetical protein